MYLNSSLNCICISIIHRIHSKYPFLFLQIDSNRMHNQETTKKTVQLTDTLTLTVMIDMGDFVEVPFKVMNEFH